MAQHPWIRKNIQLVKKRQKAYSSAVSDVALRYQTNYYKYIIKEPGAHLPHVNTYNSSESPTSFGNSPKHDDMRPPSGMIGSSCEKFKRTIKPKLSSKFINTLNHNTKHIHSYNGGSESPRKKEKESLMRTKSNDKSQKSDKFSNKAAPVPVPSWARRWWTRHNDYNQPKVGVTC